MSAQGAAAAAKTYARGLDRVSRTDAARQEAFTALAGLAQAIAEAPSLKRGLIDAAACRGADRSARLQKLLAVLPTQVRRLVELLLEDGVVEALPAVRDSFARLLGERDFRRVELESAAPLTPDQRRSLLRALGIPASKALLTVRIDPALLGGVRATVDGRVTDASLSGRLELLSEELTAVPAA